MIFAAAIWVFVFCLSVYAWKDWYRSACGLILLMAVYANPLMPRSVFGVQGLNPWNILFLSVVLAMVVGWRRQRLAWDMPRSITLLLMAYLGVVLVSTFRMLADPTMLNPSMGELVGDSLFNTLKWPLTGLLFFIGCRDRQRLRLALGTLCTLYIALVAQILWWTPFDISGDRLSQDTDLLANAIGYHRVELSMLLAGASWAIFALLPMMRAISTKSLVIVLAMTVLFGQALTGGRMGYITWAAVGLTLCVIRWRTVLLIAPVAVALVVTLLPGVTERVMRGFSTGTIDVTTYRPERDPTLVFGSPERRDTQIVNTLNRAPDLFAITSGRNFVWPVVAEQIGESALVGHGRAAMIRAGVQRSLGAYGLGFNHPHNAYLELLLDTGIVGTMLILPFYGVILWWGLSLLRDTRSSTFASVGGATVAFVLALLIGGIGSESFYPQYNSVGLWCAVGLMLRVKVERSKADAQLMGVNLSIRESNRGAFNPVASSVSQPQRRVPPGLMAGSGVVPARWAQRGGEIDTLLWQTPEQAAAIRDLRATRLPGVRPQPAER